MIDSLKHELINGSDSVRQILLGDLAWEYAYSNIDSAEYFASAALKLAERRNNLNEVARAKSMLAIVYDIQGKVDASAELYLDNARFYQETNNQTELSKTYNNLGVLFFYNENLEKSLEYYKKSLKIDESLGDSLGVARSLVNLAAIENIYGEWDRAFHYLKRGEKIALKMQNEEVTRDINEAIANNFIYQSKYDSALIYLNKSLDAFKKVGDKHSILSNLNGMIIVWRELGDYQKAEEYLREAESLAASYDDQNLRKKRNENAAKLFEKKGDFQKAYTYLKRFLVDNDSINNQERVRITAELEKKYKTEQKENEIALLQVTQQQSENQRNALFLISLLVVIGAVLLFILFRSKAKANIIISKSLAEKETLLKEIHHRVKNNLQIISSLLSMQSRFIKDEAALGAVSEGQSRVESMALIHQKLYQENHLAGVNSKEYIEDLTETLRNTYALHTDIDFQYDLDDLIIDVDTIIPLGLILNELICNSLKHAFPEQKRGIIRIELKEKDQKLILKVCDNGVGMIPSEGTSFGIVLIESLAQKLKATIETHTNNGTCTQVTISHYKLVK